MANALTTVSTKLEGQVFECVQKLQELELAYNVANPNADPINNAQIALDTELQQATITLSLPVSIALSTGGFTVTAQEYI